MNNKPLVSIVLPTHNGEQYLENSIRSCLDQTYCDIELIVVDDCSSDGTSQILQGFDDPRIRVIRNQMNRGLPVSLNIGFRCSRGEYLTWTSDDNWYSHEAIETLVKVLDSNREVGFVYSDYWTVNSNGEITGLQQVVDPEDFLTSDSNGIGACFLYKREVYQTVGEYNDKWRLVEDYDYWIRIAQQFRVFAFHHPLYFYRYHMGSLTSQFSVYRIKFMSLKLARAHRIVSRSQYISRLGDVNIGMAFFFRELNNRPKTLYRLMLGVAQNPRHVLNVGVWSVFMEMLLGRNLNSKIRRILR